jgi:hypothetical protein
MPLMMLVEEAAAQEAAVLLLVRWQWQQKGVSFFFGLTNVWVTTSRTREGKIFFRGE